MPEKGQTSSHHGLVGIAKPGAGTQNHPHHTDMRMEQGRSRGIGSPLTVLLPKLLPNTSVSAASGKHRRKAQEGAFHSQEALEPSWLLTLALPGRSGSAIRRLPGLVVVERGTVLAVGPCCVVLAHAPPVDLPGEREPGSPTATPRESLGQEQCPCQ